MARLKTRRSFFHTSSGSIFLNYVFFCFKWSVVRCTKMVKMSNCNLILLAQDTHCSCLTDLIARVIAATCKTMFHSANFTYSNDPAYKLHSDYVESHVKWYNLT